MPLAPLRWSQWPVRVYRPRRGESLAWLEALIDGQRLPPCGAVFPPARLPAETSGGLWANVWLPAADEGGDHAPE